MKNILVGHRKDPKEKNYDGDDVQKKHVVVQHRIKEISSCIRVTICKYKSE